MLTLKKKKPADYDKRVFINCPFDTQFKPIFDAIVFAIHDLGFQARHALIDDGTAVRIERITQELAESKYSLHDLSRVELGDNKLPRFNMPFEAGIAYSLHTLKPFGREHHLCVLEAEKFRYQASISDLAGLDPKAHNNDPTKAIGCVRDFLRKKSTLDLPGATHVARRFKAFSKLLATTANPTLSPDELKDWSYVNDLQKIMVGWINKYPT